ncbi:amino acid ABC transporter ATP-binding protein [Roseibium suaedae]|uniref:Amino acid ABC transporter ATP-binding protein, PAAT family n=1 Tax=Roseibium suaedae TaxID=735517 RepID=A0A1M7NUF0_9HYPH|nr:amino acid ABC transporter ATP-binding protein [Roseibium suaedae]SHN07665.1 amino acid ABC transporter ATP-binding protein, PAAT family [Roseibium suaedae]
MSFVDIKNVRKSFANVEVLKGVTINVEKGEIVTIIGRSGSGKSTLLRCINGLESIDDGEIRINGEVVHDKATDLRRLREKVGIVFQQFNLFPHMTVEQNITLAPTLTKRVAKGEAARKLAHEVLSRVGLEQKIDAYPEQLSGGQQQRVAIARCLAMGPELMLFDEVTSALDPELVGEVLKVMEDLARQGMTMILVTHEMNFARNVASKIVFMHAGKVHEQGAPAALFANPATPELRNFISSTH